ncbi:MAG: thiamine phosphate synthase [Chloroflexi bacterium]|nr:thiamine phosphate synthase [Chloroflexota bacterium]
MSLPEPSVIPYPALCLVTDRGYGQETLLAAKVAAAVDGGVNMVQLREKDLPAGDLLKLAISLREITRGKALFLVNDRVDVALASGADGVQLGEEGLPVSAARVVAGKRLIVGRSVHSLRGAQEAEASGADFLLVGTIFPTGSKPGALPAGLGLLAQIAQSVSVPFLAIGGVTSSNVAQVMAQGAAGAAVISAILARTDTCEAAQELTGAMGLASIRSQRAVPAR